MNQLIHEESSVSDEDLSKVESAESFQTESDDASALEYYKIDCLVQHYAPIEVQPGTSTNVGRVQTTLEKMGR